jgi:hypothetical protein
MPPTLHVTADKLRDALDGVDSFAMWFNASIAAKLYPS